MKPSDTADEATHETITNGASPVPNGLETSPLGENLVRMKKGAKKRGRKGREGEGAASELQG